MTTQARIAVLCPVYNTRPYLPALVESLENQLLPPAQVVFVDDGSTDGSGEYLDAVVASHPAWRVVHQENAGVAQARIVGLQYVQTPYLAFVDSDDYYAPNFLSCLVGLLEETGADCAVASMICHGADGRAVAHHFCGDRSPFLMTPSISNKVFRTAAVAGLSFPVGCWYEDLYFFHHFLLRRPALVYTQETAYHCNTREESIMSNNRAEKNLDILRVMDAIFEAARPRLLQSDREAEELGRELEASLYITVLHATIQRLYAMQAKNKRAVIREMRAYVRARYPRWWRSDALRAFPWNQRVVCRLNGWGWPAVSAALVRVKQGLKR